MKEVGLRLKELRKSRNLSQIQMAEILELKQPSINKYEHGTATPSIESLRKYADYFNVSMDYIFARTDSPREFRYKSSLDSMISSEEYERFVELCFDPDSLFYEKLKQTLLVMLKDT